MAIDVGEDTMVTILPRSEQAGRHRRVLPVIDRIRAHHDMNWILATGDVLAHYRVLSPLGAGGTGQVYLAEDVRLGRRLALKVLAPRARRDEELLKRFEREARTISALNHPNILTIYDTGRANGTQFLATEFIDGVTLRALIEGGPLPAARTVGIAVQVAQALAAAHEAGVIHRDLKPENVMLRADGYVKVLDFGLAKLTGQESFSADSNSTTAMLETRDGVVLGTFNYMAPEQARGEELDARADVFALGVLLYEMAAGQPPFKGPTAADVVGSLLFREPPPLATASIAAPPDLQRIVDKALRKDRKERYGTCQPMLDELRALAKAMESGRDSDVGARPLAFVSDTQTPAPRDALAIEPPRPGTRPPRRRRARRAIASLAVLPLASTGGDADLEYLGDGLTESLINSLSQIPRLRVMARSTVFRFKGHTADPRAVGRELDVQAVVTGQVAQRGDTVSVSAELVDAHDGSHIWGTSIARRATEVWRVQAEISEELAAALRLRLTGDERQRVVKRYTTDAEAYQAYLKGRYFLNGRTPSDLSRARAEFERAVARDPSYALACAGLADCCSLIAVTMRTSAVSLLVEQARSAALKALQLDDRLADAHASLAFIRFRFDWDWNGAEDEFTRALELNPGHAPSRHWHAMYLASRARFETALDEIGRALDLDPLSLTIQCGVGRILHFAGRFDEAAAQLDHVIATNPGFGQAHVDLALTRLAQGDLASARRELDLAEQSLGDASTIVLLRGCCAVRDGRLDDGRAAFESLRRRYDQSAAGADDLAMLAAVIGDGHAALAWLTEACARRSPFLGYVDVEPAMDALLQHPECRALLQRHGFRGGHDRPARASKLPLSPGG
jgi:serine/threonine-protein kinase